MSSTILVSGGSGFIGKRLVASLKNKGHRVLVVSRSAKKGDVTWETVNKGKIPDCDAIISLQGAGIVDKRWTKEYKKVLIDSRVQTTKALLNAVKKSKKKPKHFIATSAVCFYPTEQDEVYDETYDGPPAENFGGNMDFQLENTALITSKDINTPLSIVRMGVTLGEGGGPFSLLQLPLGLYGGNIGTGKHHVPWIHVDDAVRVYEHILEKEIKGIVNAVAPTLTTNNDMSNAIAKRGKWTVPTPSVIMKAVMGESSILVTEGQKITPKRLQETNFPFLYPTIERAMENLVK